MTGPSEPAGPDPSPAGPEQPPDSNPSDSPQGRAFSLTTFTIEGRQAPALFVVGWLATFIGAGIAALTLMGISGIAGAILWISGLAIALLGLVLLGGSQTVERRAAGAAYVGPSPMLVLLAILPASQLAGFAVGLPLSVIGAEIPRPVGDLIGAVLQAAVFIGVVWVTVVAAGSMRWREMGFVPGAGTALVGLARGAFYVLPVVPLTAIVAAVAAELAGAAPESPLPPTGTTSGLLLHLLAGAIIAPVSEELLFRGFALTAWRRSVGARTAIIRSSIVFVLAHVLFVGGDGFQEAAALAFVAATARIPVALVLGWLFVRTGSIWAPIGLHATYNAVLIILAELYIGA